MSRIAVIGAGLFGCIITHRLIADGHEVVQFDDAKPGRASAPAACLMKPSWFSGAMPRRESEAALALLDDLYGVQDLQFALRPTRGLVTVHWVDPRHILGNGQRRRDFASYTTVHGTVERIIANGGGTWMVSAVYNGNRLRPQHVNKVVVAAGVWCDDILVGVSRAEMPEAIHVDGLQGRAGSAFLWPEKCLPMDGLPFIAPWAPYKQIVGFDRGDGIWVGDGSSIKPENWTPEHSRKSRLRCLGQLNLQRHVDELPTELHGIRPYVPGAKPCYLAEHHEGVWVCTGGAKNGTIAAAWAALQLSRRLA